MVHLLDGLSALARGEAAQSLPREDVELGDLLDTVVMAARRRHPGIDLRVADDLGDLVVHGWPGGLRLVLDNLVDNAALHGGTQVDVVARPCDDGRLLVAVTDDGPGIPAAERERLLEPFARGAGVQAPGSGLGLAIVAQQVALHGGELAFDDVDPHGLRVEVRLPTAPGSPAGAPAAGGTSR
jgi:two-component system sensor histidine kinase PrrB